MVKEGNVLLFEPKVARLVGGDAVGPLSALRLFRYITVRSAGGDHGAALSWRRPENHPLVQTVEIWPGIRGQGRGSRRSGGAGAQQKRHADDGRFLMIAVLALSTMLWAQWNTQVDRPAFRARARGLGF